MKLWTFLYRFCEKKILGRGGIGEQVDPIRNIRKIYPTGFSFSASPSTFYVKHQNSINALAAFTSKDEVASTATAAFTSNRKKLMPNNKTVLPSCCGIFTLGDGWSWFWSKKIHRNRIMLNYSVLMVKESPPWCPSSSGSKKASLFCNSERRTFHTGPALPPSWWWLTKKHLGTVVISSQADNLTYSRHFFVVLRCSGSISAKDKSKNEALAVKALTQKTLSSLKQS